MREVNQSDIKTLTIAFDEFRGSPEDESPLAAEIARTYDVLNFKRVVTEEEFRADLPKIFAAMDQPSIDGINTWFVAKATRELGLKVAISGLGGDELFGGYPSFKDIPRWVSRLAVPASFPLLGSGLRRMLMFTRLDQYLPSPKAAGVLELGGSFAGAYMLRRGLFMPWELDKLMGCDTAREGLAALRPLERVGEVITPCPESTFAKVATLESSLYMRNQLLRDTDWASMAHGLEVRVPLVDNSLLQRIAKLGQPESNAMPKACLAKAPQRALPDAVVRRSKTGFVTPVGRWIEATSRNVDRFDSAESNRSKGMDSRAWSRRVLSEALL
jgi:asparagine synthase (glutamine-hydrolysing)